MIEFQSLMRAIHKGVRDAAKSVEGESLDFIKRFFDQVTVDDPDDEETGETTVLRPKTCAMEFPSRTADGINMVTVQVPIVAICPISSPRITEVKFSSELEISSTEDDKLMVAFPILKNQQEGTADQPALSSKTTNASLEITLTGNEPPEGLKKLIDGYERALRAQIPG